MSSRARSPREKAHLDTGVPFKIGTSYVKGDVCQQCGDEYEVDRICCSCMNLRIMKIAYTLITNLIADGTAYEILTKGSEAIPKFEDYFGLTEEEEEEE